MARTVVRGTPVISRSGANEGQGHGQPKGMDGQTTPAQYRGTGMSTTQGPGTPFRSQAGNSPTARRIVSSDDYGKVMSGGAGNLNNPQSNGDGVILDGVANDYAGPTAAPYADSPVPGRAPVFDEGMITTVNRARLGGASDAHARDDILNLGGVLSRGMVQKSTRGGAETELLADDTLPGLAPAGR